MKKLSLVECFADNGELSHHNIIDIGNGETVCSLSSEGQISPWKKFKGKVESFPIVIVFDDDDKIFCEDQYDLDFFVDTGKITHYMLVLPLPKDV